MHADAYLRIMLFIKSVHEIIDGLFYCAIRSGSNERIGNGYAEYGSKEDVSHDRPQSGEPSPREDCHW